MCSKCLRPSGATAEPVGATQRTRPPRVFQLTSGDPRVRRIRATQLHDCRTSGRARSQFCSGLSVESVLHLIPKVCKVPAVKTCGLKPVGTAPAAERVGQV